MRLRLKQGGWASRATWATAGTATGMSSGTSACFWTATGTAFFQFFPQAALKFALSQHVGYHFVRG